MTIIRRIEERSKDLYGTKPITMAFLGDSVTQGCFEEAAIPVCDCYKQWKQYQRVGVDVTELLANHLNHPTREMHNLFAESLFDRIINV